MTGLECIEKVFGGVYFPLRSGDVVGDGKISPYYFFICNILIKIIRRHKYQIQEFIINPNNPNALLIQIINEYKNVAK